MTQDEIKDIDRKMDEYVRRLVSRNGYGELVTKNLVNYAQTIGYLDAHLHRFAMAGLREEIRRKVRDYSNPRNEDRFGEPMSPTSAN